MNRTRCASHILCLVGACSPAFAQLDPPPGPVGPTFKTLDQVEPSTPVGPETTPGDGGAIYKITQPGSYHLTGNLRLAAPGMHMIHIATSNVTLDLRGFQLKSDSHDTLSVIHANGSRRITVKNGVVEPLSGGDGVDLEGCWTCTVENIHGSYGRRTIDAGAQATVRNCTVARSLETGISVGKGSVIEGCTLWDSPYDGANAIETGAGSLVRDTAIDHWENIGIVAGKATRIVDCTIHDVDFAGVYVDEGALITGCTISDGDGWGIYALNDAQIEGCRVSHCGFDGIRVYNRCRVVGNTCDMNGRLNDQSYGGIYVLGEANSITDNTCRDNYVYGVFIGSALNTILRNHCTGNNDDFRLLAPEQNHWAGEVRPGQAPTDPNTNYRS